MRHTKRVEFRVSIKTSSLTADVTANEDHTHDDTIMDYQYHDKSSGDDDDMEPTNDVPTQGKRALKKCGKLHADITWRLRHTLPADLRSMIGSIISRLMWRCMELE